MADNQSTSGSTGHMGPVGHVFVIFGEVKAIAALKEITGAVSQVELSRRSKITHTIQYHSRHKGP
jgi:hypothetical protein